MRQGPDIQARPAQREVGALPDLRRYGQGGRVRVRHAQAEEPMNDLPQLFTSRWANRALAHIDVTPVGISRGTPRYPVPYRYRMARLLAPSRETFAIEDLGEFERSYVKDLERVGPDRVADLLRRIGREEGGRPLCLLCFERDPAECHRAMFARWFRVKTGIVVPELDVRDFGASEDNYREQPTLF